MPRLPALVFPTLARTLSSKDSAAAVPSSRKGDAQAKAAFVEDLVSQTLGNSKARCRRSCDYWCRARSKR
jgi:hypothetical protein